MKKYNSYNEIDINNKDITRNGTNLVKNKIKVTHMIEMQKKQQIKINIRNKKTSSRLISKLQYLINNPRNVDGLFHE